VFYAGDNDLALGKTPEKVSADFQRFVALVHEEHPQTRSLFVSIKPSIKRRELIEEIRDTNSRIREFCDSRPELDYLDVHAPMQGEDGHPRKELFSRTVCTSAPPVTTCGPRCSVRIWEQPTPLL